MSKSRKMILSAVFVVAFMAAVSYGTTQIFDLVQSKDVDSLARSSNFSFLTVMIGLIYLFCAIIIGSFCLRKGPNGKLSLIDDLLVRISIFNK